MKQLKALWAKAFLSLAIMAAPMATWAADYMPFVLSNLSAATVAEASDQAKSSLQANGFEVVGEYSPSTNAQVLVVTNNALKAVAAASENGGFGAMARVSITDKDGQVQVSYTNPSYMWNAYRMKGDITPVQNAMKAALGAKKEFGADKALSADDLREYHYKMMMPYFDDEVELAEYGSYEEATKQVEAGLASGKAGTFKVYRIDIPGSKMSVFGVGLSNGEAADNYIMTKIDKNAESHAAHFPYEVLVVGDEVITLDGKFRIAMNWPSLSMMGEGSFMSISNAPDDIVTALESVAKNQTPETEASTL